MNKKLMIAAGIILLLLVGGMAYMMFFGSKKLGSPSSSNTDSGAFSSIQDALMKSISLECKYTSPEGLKTQAFIKNGMVRSEVKGETEEQSGSAIINAKEGKVYFWNSQGGFVMTMPDMSATPAEGQEMFGGAQSNLEALEQYKQHCNPAQVSDSHFVLPSDIEFKDMSQMMPSGVMAPSGVRSSGKPPAAPSGVNQQSMEELMKQYQQSAQ
jgi:hypothetical protein